MNDNVEDLTLAKVKAEQLSALMSLLNKHTDGRFAQVDAALYGLAADLALDVSCALKRVS
jgi:hypothetical protein